MKTAYAARVGRSIAGWPVAVGLGIAIAALTGACGGRSEASSAESASPGSDARTEQLLERARAEERARRYDRARALYRQAAREAPDRASAARAWRELARALLFWGEIDEAEPALARAAELAPSDVSVWHDLGLVRHRRGDLAGAERSLRRAIALAPREPRPRVALAALLVNQRRFPEALGEYRALEHLPLPERTRRAVARAISLIEEEQARPAAPAR
jgi:tetratricopeptide (TPR) repeat protein